MIAFGLAVSLITFALRLDQKNRAAKVVDLSGLVAGCGYMTGAVLDGRLSPLPLSTAVAAIVLAGSSVRRGLQPFIGWSGLWLCGAAPYLTEAAGTAASFRTPLTFAVLGLFVAATELTRSRSWRQMNGRDLLLPVLLLDIPLATAVAAMGRGLDQTRWLLDPLHANVASMPATPTSYALGSGLLLAGLVRIGLLPFCSWLFAIDRRRPARQTIIRGLYLLTLLPVGLHFVDLAWRLEAIHPSLQDRRVVAAAASLVTLLLALVTRRKQRTTLVFAAVANGLVASYGLMASLPLDPRLAAWLLAAAVGTVATRTAVAVVASPQADQQLSRLGSLTPLLTNLPISVASNLARFLDWFAIRQTLARGPALVAKLDGSHATAAWVAIAAITLLTLGVLP